MVLLEVQPGDFLTEMQALEMEACFHTLVTTGDDSGASGP